ncbi:MAG TPA: phosphoglycerate kinase, partial [bacterium]|nr:phosphoglycerate kinase [bacterium]
MNYLKLADYDFSNQAVLVRSDLDSPYDKEKNEIMDNERLSEAAKTLRYLAERGAKVVTIGHQARPGKASFTRLKRHAELLSSYCGQEVKYCDSIHDANARDMIQTLKPGELLVLENVRFSSEETLELDLEKYPTTHMVRDLEPMFAYYVQNSFTTAHRTHTSMVGFQNIPNIAGLRMQLEIDGISKAAQQADRPYVMIFGGAKIFDYFSLMDKVLKEDSVDTILAGGLLGDLCLLAKGYKLGKKMEFLTETDSLAKQKLLDLLPQVTDYLTAYPDKFVIPVDVALDVDGKRQEIPVSELPSDYMFYDIG